MRRGRQDGVGGALTVVGIVALFARRWPGAGGIKLGVVMVVFA